MSESMETNSSMMDTLPNAEAPERNVIKETLNSIVVGAEQLKGKDLSEEDREQLDEINRKLAAIMPGKELIN